MTRERITSTLGYLRKCQNYRKAGGQVAFTTDPQWLVHMAINRRAGWPDDPSLVRGSAMPVDGKYPAKASGDDWCALRLFAHKINTPRLIVRDHELPGRYRHYYLDRLSHRITIAPVRAPVT
jgi:hypothetical protein